MAQRRGELDDSIEPEQLAFEVDSLMLGANAALVLLADEVALPRALNASANGSTPLLHAKPRPRRTVTALTIPLP
jgi:hypothetical protein